MKTAKIYFQGNEIETVSDFDYATSFQEGISFFKIKEDGIHQNIAYFPKEYGFVLADNTNEVK